MVSLFVIHHNAYRYVQQLRDSHNSHDQTPSTKVLQLIRIELRRNRQNICPPGTIGPGFVHWLVHLERFARFMRSVACWRLLGPNKQAEWQEMTRWDLKMYRIDPYRSYGRTKIAKILPAKLRKVVTHWWLDLKRWFAANGCLNYPELCDFLTDHVQVGYIWVTSGPFVIGQYHGHIMTHL